MLMYWALLIAAASSCAVPSVEVTGQRRMAYEAFDSMAGPYGWRFLLDAGCPDSAVELLRSYSKANAGLKQYQRLELQFHIGQTLAMSGHDEEAIPYFEKAFEHSAPKEWRTYVQATLAFLRHDTSMLVSARAVYAGIAPSSMRLKIIDGMVACSDESYAKAIHCRM